jgi:hypothetical protein
VTAIARKPKRRGLAHHPDRAKARSPSKKRSLLPLGETTPVPACSLIDTSCRANAPPRRAAGGQ